MTIHRYEGNGRMSKAVVHNGLVFLCGQVGSGKDIQEQTRETLAKVEALLEAHGSDKDHILSAVIHLKDMALFSQMNEVWDPWIRDGSEPARTCVEAKLADENLLVEVTVIAAQK